jgi:hypothetical protein
MREIDDTAIERHALAFLDRTLEKSEWTHIGHNAAALWLTRHRPHLATPANMRDLIMRYNAATNTPNTDTGGYHHTITVASLRAAAQHLKHYSSDISLSVVLGDLIVSPFGDKNWLLSYWHKETLFSVAARRHWVAPDIQDMPF